MAIQSIAIGTSNTTIFTATSDQMIATMIFCNILSANPSNDTANSTTLTLYLVPSGSTLSSTNMIVNSLYIPATETVFFDTERIVLQNGDSIVAVAANSSSVTCTISTVAI